MGFGFGIIESVYKRIGHMYRLDFRSLALYRAFMGIVIICDLIHRLGDLRDHYTGEGLVYIRNYHGLMVFHSLSTSIYFQSLMFTFHLSVAFMFAIGYKTKINTVILWFLTVSLLEYNYYLNSGGDALLRLTMFWAMFLPLGNAYSVDCFINSKKKTDSNKSVFNVASIAFIVQVQLMYMISTTYKVGEHWNVDYKATYISLRHLYFQTPLAKVLLLISPQFVLQAFTWIVLKIELLGPLTLTFPIWNDLFRTIGVLLFIILHVGFGTSMYLGIFMWVPIAYVCGFLPGRFWSFISDRMKSERNMNDLIIKSHDSKFSYILGRTIKLFLVPSYTRVVSNDKMRNQSFSCDMDQIKEFEKKYLTIQLGGTEKAIHNLEAISYFFTYICQFTSPFQFFYKLFWPKFVSIICGKIFNKLHFLTLHNKRDLKIMEYKKKLAKIPINRSKLIGIFNISTKTIIQCVLLYLLTLVFLSNLNNSKVWETSIAKSASKTLFITSLHQSWRMFSPNPPKLIFVPVIKGTLANNETIDLFSNGAIVKKHWTPIPFNDTFTVPPSLNNLITSHRWFKVFELGFRNQGPFLRTFGQYVCIQYNKRNFGLQVLKRQC